MLFPFTNTCAASRTGLSRYARIPEGARRSLAGSTTVPSPKFRNTRCPAPASPAEPNKSVHTSQCRVELAALVVRSTAGVAAMGRLRRSANFTLVATSTAGIEGLARHGRRSLVREHEDARFVRRQVERHVRRRRLSVERIPPGRPHSRNAKAAFPFTGDCSCSREVDLREYGSLRWITPTSGRHREVRPAAPLQRVAQPSFVRSPGTCQRARGSSAASPAVAQPRCHAGRSPCEQDVAAFGKRTPRSSGTSPAESAPHWPRSISGA